MSEPCCGIVQAPSDPPIRCTEMIAKNGKCNWMRGKDSRFHALEHKDDGDNLQCPHCYSGESFSCRLEAVLSGLYFSRLYVVFDFYLIVV